MEFILCLPTAVKKISALQDSPSANPFLPQCNPHGAFLFHKKQKIPPPYSEGLVNSATDIPILVSCKLSFLF